MFPMFSFATALALCSIEPSLNTVQDVDTSG